MKDFVILTDSCGDLPRDLREKYNMEYVPMHYCYDGKDVIASLDWEFLSATDFYNVMRSGKRIITSQVNDSTFEEAFERFVSEGRDVLYIACSSALSSSVNASYRVRDAVLKKYPAAKIICVDSLNSCSGLALLCIRASELRAEGKSIEEVASWITENCKKVNQECTVDSLKYLKQAGRVSAASAFFGGILSVKPIIISDVNGQNVAVEKVKGRKNSLDRIVERFVERYESLSYQRIFIVHADCLEEATALKERIYDVLVDKDVEIYINYIGPTVGASVGPGTIGVYFFGKEVTYDSKTK